MTAIEDIDRPSLYTRAATILVAETGVTIRKFRGRNTGIAYTRADDWGIETPAPTGPVSFGVFAHEVAHQVLHRPDRAKRRPRWQEEIEAEEWALAQFDRFDLPGREQYERTAARNVAYAIGKALRRSRGDNRRQLTARISGQYPQWWRRAEEAA